MSGITKVYRQSGQVIAGEGLAAVFGFAALTLCARALGPDVFGQFALLLAFAAAIELLFNFQSGRLLIRYGASAQAAGNVSDMSRLLKLALFLDMAGAAVATAFAVLIGFVGLPFLGDVNAGLVYLLAVAMIFNIVGHATALLRLSDRFGFLAIQRVVASLLRLLGVGAFLLADGLTLRNAILAFVLADICARVLLVVRARREATNLGLGGFMQEPLAGIRQVHSDLVSFVLFANVNEWVLKVVQQLDVFIVAALLSPADAGFFRVVKSLGAVPALISGAIGQVIYPEIARLSASTAAVLRGFLRRLWGVLIPTAVVCSIAYWFVAEPVVVLLFGHEYLPVATASIVYMVGWAMELTLVPLTPLSLVSGRQRDIFLSYCAASTVYVLGLFLGSRFAGLNGASAAFMGLVVTFGVSMGVLRTIRDRK